MCSSEANKSSSQKGLVSTDRSKMTALLSTTPRLKPRSSTNDFAPLHSMGLLSFAHPGQNLGPETARCCGFATASAGIGRPAHIIASQCRGTDDIVTFLGGILT